MTHYKRCPPNRILVIHGKLPDGATAKCVRGGAFVSNHVQEYQYLSLRPITIDLAVKARTSQQTSVEATFRMSMGLSTEPDLMMIAAERLLGLREAEIGALAEEIMAGVARDVISKYSIEKIARDHWTFQETLTRSISVGLNKVGANVLNLDLDKLIDSGGYLELIERQSIAKLKGKIAEVISSEEQA